MCDAQQQDVEPVETFLRSLCELPYCFNWYHHRFTSCACLREISEHFLFEDVAQMLGKWDFYVAFIHIQLPYLAELISLFHIF